MIRIVDEDADQSPYDEGYACRISGADLDESLCDDWVAGWYDANSNLRYEAENPLPN
ncbi:hypothetical protein [Pseudomonas sp. PS01302]|uniref:hypothetical protein n=1 Tax=Pseudomonas sp. PS01302 TaxID=2991438 RepID=UPI00249C2BF7|nr:hypothetical protein [Pseudomonas sp. PS01302]